MPYIPKKKLPFDKLLDQPLSKLPDTKELVKGKNELWEEWQNLQYGLDQGAYTTRAQIEKAAARMIEIEEIIETLGD